MAKFFRIPFAASASKSTIPDNDGSNVSWNSGYTVNYEYNPLTNNQAKHIERDVMNSLFYDITSSIQQFQLNGVSPYYEDIISPTGPGYAEGAFVSYGGNVWRSKISNNKVIPNANSTKNWELVLGYDSLVQKLDKDGHLGGGGNTNSGYSKEEIDKKLEDLNTAISSYATDTLQKVLGEIYLLTWCDQDRNDEGFFLCNGDKLPYTTDGSSGTGDDETLVFYGNQLYDLCYSENDTGDGVVETAFKKRWNIQIDTANKTIQIPNILGLRSDGTVASETDNVILSLSKNAAAPDPNAGTTNVNGGSSSVKKTYFFKMLPCIYLGTN